MKRGKFIVLEGLDGTGKSTQVAMLRDVYDKKGIPNFYIHFPRTNDESPVFGEMVARFLRGDYGPIEAVHPELVALIYAGDRYNAAQEINDKLNAGIHVIADRYVFSNIGFQCAKLENQAERAELMQLIFHMEYNYFKIPEPDISIFLHVPIAFVEQKLNATREGDDRTYLKGKEDIHEKSIEFQKNVEQVYLDACKQLPSRLKYLNCMNDQGEMMSPQEIHEALVAQLLTEY